MTRRRWLRPIALAIAFGLAGAAAGATVAAWRDADLTSGVAWGLYLAGGALLFFAGAPGMQMAPSIMVTSTMPDAARTQIQGQQRSRIGGLPVMFLNFALAVALIGLGALFEIYG